MNSPFSIFRRHQKILMVVFTGLAMFSFIFLDSLQSSKQASPVIIGVLFGGFAMWIIGLIRGKWLEYALIGMAGGGIAGFVMNFAGEPAPRVSTSIAKYSDQDLQKLVTKRYIANQFLELAFFESRKPEEKEQAQIPRNSLFSFGRSLEEDVVLGQLLCAEAKQMGLVVSDQAVERYINQVTSDQLSRAKFEKIVRQDMRVSSVELYDILREQLLARQAFQMIVPRNLLSPEQYWQYYQKFNIRQELVLTAVPVETFKSEVPDPKEEELKAYFAAHSAVFPNQTGEGVPGFRVPRKVSIAYLEARPSSLEPEVQPVTDADVENYYNTNKELYRELSTDLLEGNSPTGGDKPAGESGTDDATLPDATDKPAGDKPEGETPPGDDAAKPESETPSSEEKSDAEKSNESSDATRLDRSKLTAQAVFSVDDDAAKNEAQPDAAEASKPDQSSADEAKSDEAKTDPPASESGDPATTTETSPKSELSEPMYKPLNDELKNEIRNDLHSQQLRELIRKRIGEAQTFMTDLSDNYRLPDDPAKKMTPADVADAMKAYAAKHGLTYGEIPLSSFEELEDSERYPMASAEEPTDNPLSMQENRNVRIQMFETGVDQLYLAMHARDRLTDVAYAYWKTGDVDSHIATFEDPGIRELVLETWKTEKARPIAENRAKDLVEMLKKDERPWEEALAETTVTGAQEGLQLSVQTTESFSWMRSTSAPSANMFSFPQPELSTISSVEKAGDAFMKAVFQDLKDGEVGTAPNADRSIYYVVKVRNRFPNTPAEVEAQRQAFMHEDLFFFSPYPVLASMEHNERLVKWSQQLEEKYAVLWRTDNNMTDTPPLEE